MRLSSVFFVAKFVKGIPGNIWIGKHRYVPPVTKNDRLEMWKKLMYEEEVMMYLSNPYLTEEQENNYLKEHPEEVWQPTPGFLRGKRFTREIVPLDLKEPLEENTTAFHLSRLNNGRSWE